MNSTTRKIIAVIVVLITLFGWFFTVKGIPGEVAPLTSKIQRGLDIEGGVYVVLEAQNTEGMKDEELKEAMERTQAVIENRVNALGLTNPDVSIEGTKRIRVELPGMENAEEAIKLIGQTAKLTFTLADGTPILDGEQVKNASIGTSEEYAGYVVELEFDGQGSKAFEEATKKTAAGGVPATISYPDGTMVLNNSIVIQLDGEVISAPKAEKVISSTSCIIEGNFTQEQAANLAALIKGGALPIELKEISSSSQTATIGLNAFEKSVKAGIIGLVIIFLLMLFFYRIMGLAADIALALYIVMVLGAMALMDSVLTLPGIAGIILSIGMAVDANVIIFNRIKEEIVAGKSIRVATKSGYKRALGTVMDSQITTLIATVILYQLGTSAVKGFAWTLMIGIICSIITAVVITQLLLNLFAESKTFGKNTFFCVKEDGTPLFRINKTIDVISHRKKFLVGSGAVIVAGLVIALFVGLNMGIDFSGGTMIHMDMHKQVTAEQVEKVAEKQGINTKQMEVVFTGKNQEQAIIRTNESLDNKERQAFVDALQTEFDTTDKDVLESEHFGPTVGSELTNNALKALALAALGMLIYIRLRFKEWKFGAAAILGVLHDVLIMIAFYGFFRITVNNPFIAAILTVVGYSINDTIVIFDRVRENIRLRKSGDTGELLNTSINQTLSRSLMTSFTTLIVMVPLLLMAGSAIHEFTLPLMVGVITGCYSSIFICSPLYYIMTGKERKSRYEKQIASKGKKTGKAYPGLPKKEKPQKKDAVEAVESENLEDTAMTDTPVEEAVVMDAEQMVSEQGAPSSEMTEEAVAEVDESMDLEDAQYSTEVDEDILAAAEKKVSKSGKKAYHGGTSKAGKKK